MIKDLWCVDCRTGPDRMHACDMREGKPSAPCQGKKIPGVLGVTLLLFSRYFALQPT